MYVNRLTLHPRLEDWLDAQILPRPPHSYLLALNNVVRSLHNTGMWDTIVSFGVLCVNELGNGLVDLKDPANRFTPNGTPGTFAPYTALAGDGKSFFLDTHINLLTHPTGFTNTDVMLGIFVDGETDIVGIPGHGTYQTSNGLMLTTKRSTNLGQVWACGLTSTVSKATQIGLMAVGRTQADNMRWYNNELAFNLPSAVGAAPFGNIPVYIFRRGKSNSFSNEPVTMFWVGHGQGVTDFMVAQLYWEWRRALESFNTLAVPADPITNTSIPPPHCFRRETHNFITPQNMFIIRRGTIAPNDLSNATTTFTLDPIDGHVGLPAGQAMPTTQTRMPMVAFFNMLRTQFPPARPNKPGETFGPINFTVPGKIANAVMRAGGTGYGPNPVFTQQFPTGLTMSMTLGDVTVNDGDGNSVVHHNAIASVTLLTPGVRYPVTGTLTLTDATGVDAQINFQANPVTGAITSLDIANPGENYTAPTASFAVPTGTDYNILPVVQAGVITRVVIVEPGKNFPTSGFFTFVDGTGTGAQGQFTAANQASIGFLEFTNYDTAEIGSDLRLLWMYGYKWHRDTDDPREWGARNYMTYKLKDPSAVGDARYWYDPTPWDALYDAQTMNHPDGPVNGMVTNRIDTVSALVSVAGTYNSATGVIVLTLNPAYTATFAVGTQVVLETTKGTGTFAALNGTYPAIAPIIARTLSLQGPIGAGAASITYARATPQWSDPLSTRSTIHVDFEVDEPFASASPGITLIASLETSTVPTFDGTGTLTINSGTYVPTTGFITLQVTSVGSPLAHNVLVTLADLTGTGNFAGLQGTWRAMPPTNANVITLAGPPGLVATTITGGTGGYLCQNTVISSKPMTLADLSKPNFQFPTWRAWGNYGTKAGFAVNFTVAGGVITNATLANGGTGTMMGNWGGLVRITDPTGSGAVVRWTTSNVAAISQISLWPGKGGSNYTAPVASLDYALNRYIRIRYDVVGGTFTAGKLRANAPLLEFRGQGSRDMGRWGVRQWFEDNKGPELFSHNAVAGPWKTCYDLCFPYIARLTDLDHMPVWGALCGSEMNDYRGFPGKVGINGLIVTPEEWPPSSGLMIDRWTATVERWSIISKAKGMKMYIGWDSGGAGGNLGMTNDNGNRIAQLADYINVVMRTNPPNGNERLQMDQQMDLYRGPLKSTSNPNGWAGRNPDGTAIAPNSGLPLPTNKMLFQGGTFTPRIKAEYVTVMTQMIDEYGIRAFEWGGLWGGSASRVDNQVLIEALRIAPGGIFVP